MSILHIIRNSFCHKTNIWDSDNHTLLKYIYIYICVYSYVCDFSLSLSLYIYIYIYIYIHWTSGLSKYFRHLKIQFFLYGTYFLYVPRKLSITHCIFIVFSLFFYLSINSTHTHIHTHTHTHTHTDIYIYIYIYKIIKPPMWINY